jgi:lipid II:glycine glycyltransferase (peptidoglycan interpeptide bridge formation enzyme)
MTDIRQTKKYATYMAAVGWKVEKVDGVYCYLRKFPVIGYFVKIQRPKNFGDLIIRRLRKKYRIFQIVIEPENEYIAYSIKYIGFNRSKNPYVPSKTLIVDLTKSPEKILANFKKDARYAIRKTNNVLIHEEKDIRTFHDGWRHSVSLSRYVIPINQLFAMKKTFEKDCVFLSNDNISSGAIFLLADKTVYYWQAFTSKSARKTLIQYKIVYEGMLWGKKRGAKQFDFEGIYDERFPQKTWAGFTHFKKSFGGREVLYPGALVKKGWRWGR